MLSHPEENEFSLQPLFVLNLTVTGVWCLQHSSKKKRGHFLHFNKHGLNEKGLGAAHFKQLCKITSKVWTVKCLLFDIEIRSL